MKPEGSLFAVVQVALKASATLRKARSAQRNLGWREQNDLKAFFTGRKVWCLQPATIEKMYLIDMGDIDQGEGVSSTATSAPASSRVSRMAACAVLSPFSMKPPGKVQ